MAGENDVVINAAFDGGDASQGVGDLLGRFEALGPATQAIGDALNDLNLQQVFADGVQMTDLFHISLRIGMELIHETASALENMIAAYDKAAGVVDKFYDQKEKRAAGGKGASDDLTDSHASPEVEAALREMGAINRGFAPQGTWTRRAQDIGQGAMDLEFGGNSSEDNLAEGKKLAGRQREIDKNNEEEQARRQFASKAEEQRLRQEQSDYDKWAKEQHDIDEKEKRDAERALLAEAKQRDGAEKELGMAEAAQAKRREDFANQQKRQAIGRDGFDGGDPEKQFRASMVSFDAIYNSMASAAGGSKTDPVAERKRIQTEEKAHRDEILEKKLKFDRDLFDQREAKEDARLAELRKGLGLA